jgi:hypothetical protein
MRFTNCAAVPVGQTKAIVRAIWGGISDSLSSSQHLRASTDVSLRQVKDVVLKYLHDHPEQRGQAAFSVSREALTLAFPCKEQAH